MKLSRGVLNIYSEVCWWGIIYFAICSTSYTILRVKQNKGYVKIFRATSQIEDLRWKLPPVMNVREFWIFIYRIKEILRNRYKLTKNQRLFQNERSTLIYRWAGERFIFSVAHLYIRVARCQTSCKLIFGQLQ